MTILCARCGVPVRMTSLGCYGHLAPQVVGPGKPHAAKAAPLTYCADYHCPGDARAIDRGECLHEGPHSIDPLRGLVVTA